MAPARPMLDDVELQQVQEIEVARDQVLVQHAVPALEGDFFQGLARRATAVTLTGVLTGAEAAEGLKRLREKFRAAEPVPFVADITTATQVKQVLIEEMGVRELAGKPERFEYTLTLREYIPPPPPEIEPPPPEPPPPPPSVTSGKLRVEVTVEGQPNFDFSRITVTAQGTQDDGASLSRTMTERQDNVWKDEAMPPGQYTAEAVASASAAVTGSATGRVRAGQETTLQITLRVGAVLAKMFLVHFRFDKSFVEPCMRNVLQQVVDYAAAHSDEKLVIVGHTDKVGDDPPREPLYNQSLSERRARSVYAFLTFGRDRAGALAEWNQLRQRRPTGTRKSINDSWGTREYQSMLQDLGYYPGPIDGDHGSRTNEAVSAYRRHKGLPPGTTVDDDVWVALSEDYMAPSSFAVPESRFLPNCPGEILRWLGCGEEDPVKNTRAAHRPNRRVELLFVRAEALPCRPPPPDTLDLPPAANGQPRPWCVREDLPICGHFCFVSPHLERNAREPEPCSTPPPDRWTRQYAEPGSITVRGSIRRELPDSSLEPVPGQQFILISATGEFKRGEDPRGEGVADSTRDGTGEARGTFEYANMPVGWYHLEVQAPASRPVLVRLDDKGDETIRGNGVCKHLGPEDSDLDVVIVNAPVLREIRLPVVAHLVTALGPDGATLHTTARDEAGVRQALDGANRIWRQARIRFELQEVVRQIYQPPPPAQPAVSEDEFLYLLENCSYPGVINVFCVQRLSGTTEVGFGVSYEDGTDMPGCAVADENQAQSPITLAHELGHFLNLKHPEDQPGAAGPFSHLLMHGGLKSDTQLTADEVDGARASQGAYLEDQPLTLAVSGGAEPVCGGRGPNYAALQQVAGPITVEAQVPPAHLALSTVAMEGGVEVAGFPLRRNVDRTSPDRTLVKATMTGAIGPGGASRIYRFFARISVVSFELQVQGNNVNRLGDAGSNIFVTAQHPTDLVTVVASITRADHLPVCRCDRIVQWNGGDPVPGDPFRHTVSKAEGREVAVSATFAATTRSVVIRVYDLAFVADRAPYGTRIEQVRWEDAFRLRADLPGETRDEITIEIDSYLIRH